METEYRTMPDLLDGALYHHFVLFLHHVYLSSDMKQVF